MAERKKKPDQLSAMVVCPIFISASETEIVCRSCVNGAQCSVLRYDDQCQREQQSNIFCKQNYKRCEQYRAYQHFSWQDE